MPPIPHLPDSLTRRDRALFPTHHGRAFPKPVPAPSLAAAAAGAWESATIARLVARLYDYFDLEERLFAIEEKASYLSDPSSTLLDLLSHRKGRHLERIVVVLITIEILILIYAELVR